MNKIIVLSLLVVLVIAGRTEAMNPDISYWMKNISESPLSTEPRKDDLSPQIVVVGSTVHVTWTARNADDTASVLYYRRSTDDGETWQAKQVIFEASDAWLHRPTGRKMAVDGTSVHIFQEHSIYPGGSWHDVLSYMRSTDNGATFETPRIVVDGGAVRHVHNVYVSAAGGTVTVGYDNILNYQEDNYTMVLTSDNGGTSFSSHQVVHIFQSQELCDMQRVGDAMYALVRTNGDGVLHLFASANAGVSFTDAIISVPSETGAHQTGGLQDQHYVPKIAAVGAKVSVIFNGRDSDGGHSVFYRRSLDSGVTFEAAVNLSRVELPGATIQRGLETVVAKGDYVYLVFVTTDGQIYLKRSTNSGGSVLPLQGLTKPGIGNIASGWWPVAVVDPVDTTGATVHIYWRMPTYIYSTDGGATFANPVLTAPNFTLVTYDRPQMAVGSNGVLHFTGEGVIRVGYDRDIFYRRLAPRAPAPLATNQAMKFHTEHLNDDNWLGIFDNMQVKASSDTNFKTAMTAEAWVKVNRDFNTAGYFIYKSDPGAGGARGSYMLGQWRNGNVDAHITTTSGGYILGGATPVPNDVWTHLAMTYDAAGGADNFKIYINGAPAGSTTATGNLATDSGILFIGGDPSLRYYTDVKVDELRFWNKALTQAEIAQYMSGSLVGTEPGLAAYYNFNGTTRDITGHGNDGVLMYQETFVTDAAPAPYLVTVAKSGAGSGSVTSSPTGIECGSVCSATFGSAAILTLTATATAGTTASWTDCTANGGVTGGTPAAATCTFSSLSTAKTVTATFTVSQYTVTTTAHHGSITSPVNPEVTHGQTALVTGSADAGYFFTGVSGCSGTAQSNTDPAIKTFSYPTGEITGACTVTADFTLAATDTVTWLIQPGPNMNVARMGQNSASLDDGRVILFGGRGTGFIALDSAESYDLQTNSFTELHMNYPHDFAALAKLLDGRYIIAGGSKNSGVPDYTTTDIFDPQTNQFTATSGTMVRSRMAAVATTLTSGKALIVGAWYNTASATYGEVFDPATATFSATGALVTPRSYACVLPTSDGKAVLFGGMPPYGGTGYQRVELYNPETNSFTVLQETLIPGETGWLIASYPSMANQNRMPNGNYLLLANRTTGSLTEYTLFTFNPDTKLFSKVMAVPSLPDTSTMGLFPPVVDTGKNRAYIMASSLTAGPAKMGFYTFDPVSNTLYPPESLYPLPTGYFMNGSPKANLCNGSILVTGSSSGDNFGAVNKTLIATPAGAIPVTVTANAAGAGRGVVSSTPTGISYSYNTTNSAHAAFSYGATVVLTATADTGSSASWTDCTANGGVTGGTPAAATCTFSSLSTARTVTATFALNQYQLSFTLAGTGGGSVNSTPSGLIACTWPPLDGTCSASQPYNTAFTLTATASTDSSFGGWGGDCSACSGLTCGVRLDRNLDCSATMNILPLVQIAGPNYYASIVKAYSHLSAGDPATMKTQSVLFLEDLTFDQNIPLTLKGGYDSGFSANSGYTTLHGILTIQHGSLVVDRFIVK